MGHTDGMLPTMAPFGGNSYALVRNCFFSVVPFAYHKHVNQPKINSQTLVGWLTTVSNHRVLASWYARRLSPCGTTWFLQVRDLVGPVGQFASTELHFTTHANALRKFWDNYYYDLAIKYLKSGAQNAITHAQSTSIRLFQLRPSAITSCFDVFKAGPSKPSINVLLG